MATEQRIGLCMRVACHFKAVVGTALSVWWVLLLAAFTSLGFTGTAQARETAQEARTTTTPVVALASLPEAARRTYQLILSGGPFPYPNKDGSVFGNRERQLPRQKRGYYREYTVPTPGSRDRGARRIVCGGNSPATPEVCYYTSDHYASFSRIAP